MTRKKIESLKMAFLYGLVWLGIIALAVSGSTITHTIDTSGLNCVEDTGSSRKENLTTGLTRGIEMELTNNHSIHTYMHCGLCLEEKPSDISPRDFAELEIGWTEIGFQVWCKRHDCNVMSIDFEGHTHPAETTRKFIPERDLKSVG